MKSITYSIIGKARNLDDFIDLCNQEATDKIEVDLLHEETINPMCILRHLIARFSGRVSGREVEIKTIMGACIAHESEKEQRLSLNEANKKLEKYLSRLEKTGMEIKGLNNRFDDSLIYKFCVVHKAPAVKERKRKPEKVAYKPDVSMKLNTPGQY